VTKRSSLHDRPKPCPRDTLPHREFATPPARTGRERTPSDDQVKGTLTSCANFESFAGAKFPITGGSFTMSIKGLLPGGTCVSLSSGMGPKTKAKPTFKFTGINPKNGKPATATKATTVEVAGMSDDLYGQTIVSLAIADPKSLFDGRTVTLRLAYDESGFDLFTTCDSKKGVSKLHFGTVLDKDFQWLPFNGPSSFGLD
jgi:hypothetical protein